MLTTSERVDPKTLRRRRTPSPGHLSRGWPRGASILDWRLRWTGRLSAR